MEGSNGGQKYLQDKALIEARLTNLETAVSSLTAGQTQLREAMVSGQDRALERMDKGFNALSNKIDSKFVQVSNNTTEIAKTQASSLTMGRAIGILFAAATLLTAILFGVAELIL